jgi:prepilin-type N-terminal cleavage/methylation domain-containing protein
MSKKVQKGFTLIEMLVALAILSLIVAIGMSVFDGSKSKAQALLGLTKQMSDANIMAKEDIGCFANNPVGLFDQTAANTAYPCKSNPQLTRLYMPRQQTANSNTEIKFTKVAEDVTIAFGRVAGGLGNRYYVQAKAVPMDVLKHALSECNGDTNVGTTMVGVTNLSTFRCVASTLSGDRGDFYMQYAETR